MENGDGRGLLQHPIVVTVISGCMVAALGTLGWNVVLTHQNKTRIEKINTVDPVRFHQEISELNNRISRFDQRFEANGTPDLECRETDTVWVNSRGWTRCPKAYPFMAGLGENNGNERMNYVNAIICCRIK